MKTIINFFMLGAILSFVHQAGATTIFPVATNSSGIYLAGGIATSGSNYIVGIALNQTDPCVQLVSTNGTLVGSLQSIGESEGAALVAFCKSNYLAFWASDNDNGFGVDIFGQLIAANGTPVGSAFALLASLGSHGADSQAETAVAADGTNFLVAWIDESPQTGDPAFFGQFVSPNGTLVGPDFLLGDTLGSQQSDTHAALVFGSTNYLFAWQQATGSPVKWNTYGVFVSRSGSVGTPFQISQLASLDYDPPVAAFDGTNFFVVMNIDTNQTAGGGPLWNIYGRLVSQSGAFAGNESLLATNQVTINSLAFDGTDYLLTWGDNTYSTNTAKNQSFQFYNRSAMAIGPVFTPFPVQGTNTPLFGAVVFDGSRFAAGNITGNLIVGSSGNIMGLNSGAIYATIIPASTTSPVLTGGNHVGFQFPLQLTGTPGINYAIQFSTNLAISSWTSISTNSPTNGNFSYTDNNATNVGRFYRALKQ